MGDLTEHVVFENLKRHIMSAIQIFLVKLLLMDLGLRLINFLPILIIKVW